MVFNLISLSICIVDIYTDTDKRQIYTNKLNEIAIKPVQ